MNSITIHKAREEDAAAIALLAQLLAVEEGEESRCDEAAVQRLMVGEQKIACTIAVAKHAADGVVGFVLAYQGYDLASDSVGWHVADICVANTHRRKGVARMLIQFIREQEPACAWMSLTVLADNEAASRFYQALGFEKIGVDFMAMSTQS